MSGHSKWSTIKRQKGVTDARRGNLFTKLSNAISISVREGGSGDPNFNFKLRLAIDKAKEANMPKDNIARAVDKGLGKGEGNSLESATYEGFGPGGVAVIVETITDNRTRTGSELRNFFDKAGGSLGGPGAVAYMFNRFGEIELAKNGMNLDQVFEKALEAEAEDVLENEESFLVYTKPEDLHRVKEKLESGGLKILGSEIVYKPNVETMVNITDPVKLETVHNFLENVSDLDDVHNVFENLN